jgi:hypothetical protein
MNHNPFALINALMIMGFGIAWVIVTRRKK